MKSTVVKEQYYNFHIGDNSLAANRHTYVTVILV